MGFEGCCITQMCQGPTYIVSVVVLHIYGFLVHCSITYAFHIDYSILLAKACIDFRYPLALVNN